MQARVDKRSRRAGISVDMMASATFSNRRRNRRKVLGKLTRIKLRRCATRSRTTTTTCLADSPLLNLQPVCSNTSPFGCSHPAILGLLAPRSRLEGSMACEEGNFRVIVMTAALTEMPRCRLIAIQSERARRRSPRAFTSPASWIAPPNSSDRHVAQQTQRWPCRFLGVK